MFGNYVTAIAAALDNSIWLGTFDNGLMHLVIDDDLNEEMWLFYDTDHGLPSNYISGIAIDSMNETLWIGHDNGVSNCTVIE